MSKEEAVKLIDGEFKEELLSKLYQLRNEGILCDVTLRIEGQDFAAHRCVLSAASPFFRALFTSELTAVNNSNLLELKELKSTAAAEALRFMYTGEALVDSTNAQDLLKAADYLIIDGLKTKVARFLKDTINATNCLFLESFGAQLNCELLEHAATTHKLQNFFAVTKSEDFKALNFEKAKELVCRDDIVVSREEEVYEAVVTWVKHDLSSRECLFPELLKCVRLFSMSKYSLREIVGSEELVVKSRTNTRILHEGMDFFMFPDLFQSMSLKSRACLDMYKLGVVVTGGHQTAKTASNSVYCFLLTKNRWLSLQKMPQPRTRHGAAVCCGQLYIFGGSEPGKMYSFYPKQNKWTSDVKAFPSRQHCSVTTYNEELYVIGGDGCYRTRVDKYDPALDEWKEVTTMKTPRAAHCAVAMANFIYVIAGEDGEDCLKSVECFNPLTNRWFGIADLNNARKFAAAAASNVKIFVAGGYKDMHFQTIDVSCEMFDPAVNEWSLVSSPTVPRAACGIISFGNHVYLFGGENTSSKLDSVERYDVQNNKWQHVGTMPEKLSCLQASLLQIPNKYVV